jgi:hypothetical protein
MYFWFAAPVNFGCAAGLFAAVWARDASQGDLVLPVKSLHLGLEVHLVLVRLSRGGERHQRHLLLGVQLLLGLKGLLKGLSTLPLFTPQLIPKPEALLQSLILETLLLFPKVLAHLGEGLLEVLVALQGSDPRQLRLVGARGSPFSNQLLQVGGAGGESSVGGTLVGLRNGSWISRTDLRELGREVRLCCGTLAPQPIGQSVVDGAGGDDAAVVGGVHLTCTHLKLPLQGRDVLRCHLASVSLGCDTL